MLCGDARHMMAAEAHLHAMSARARLGELQRVWHVHHGDCQRQCVCELSDLGHALVLYDSSGQHCSTSLWSYSTQWEMPTVAAKVDMVLRPRAASVAAAAWVVHTARLIDH